MTLAVLPISLQRQALDEMIARIQPQANGPRGLASFTEGEAELLRAASQTMRWLERNEAAIKHALGRGR